MAPLAPEMPTMMRWRGSDMGGHQRGLLRQGMGVQVGLDVPSTSAACSGSKSWWLRFFTPYLCSW
jgi:hypothetical protein